MTKITAPDAANLKGEHRTYVGATELVFTDGVAEHDDLPDGVRAYLAGAGYSIDGEQNKPAADLQRQDALDAREVTHAVHGTELRDAAVDPRKGDFLAPVNAGEADPHGPLVVAPGIHAEGERVVVAGPVPSDPAEQDAKESRFAEKVLIDGEKITPPSGADWKEGTGPLQLSDPLSAAEGVMQARKAADGREDGEPKGNAGRDAWVEWARSKGAPDSELAAQADGGLSRDDLRANYGS